MPTVPAANSQQGRKIVEGGSWILLLLKAYQVRSTSPEAPDRGTIPPHRAEGPRRRQGIYKPTKIFFPKMKVLTLPLR